MYSRSCFFFFFFFFFFFRTIGPLVLNDAERLYQKGRLSKQFNGPRTHEEFDFFTLSPFKLLKKF